jgi:hypothetical protein
VSTIGESQKRAVPEAPLDNFTTLDLGSSSLSGLDSHREEAKADPSGGVLRFVNPNKRPGEVIAKLASSRMFVSQDASVYALAAGMEKNPRQSSTKKPSRSVLYCGGSFSTTWAGCTDGTFTSESSSPRS